MYEEYPNFKDLRNIADQLSKEYCQEHTYECKKAEFYVDNEVIYVCPLCPKDIKLIKRLDKKGR